MKSKYYKMTKSLKFTFNMDLLLGAGLTVDRSLEILSSMEDNVVLKSKFLEVLRDIKSGDSFYKSTSKINVFPKILVSMIRVGEESSNLKEVFSIMSSFYDEELNNYNKRFLGVLGPILIIIMALIIGFI
ncbi:MAG: type II secretion system F family protein, partial [Peptoniphilus grossensis]